MSDRLLEAIEPSLRAAGIRRVTPAHLDVFAFLWWLVQGIAMGLYLLTFETAALHSAFSGEISRVRMTGAAWLYSLPGAVLVRAIEAADWLATLSVLVVGLLGLVRRAERVALLLVLLTLLDVILTNVPCSEPYDNGLWTIAQTPSTLRVDSAGFFRRKTITVTELGKLESVCAETHAGFPWRQSTTVDLRYRDGRSGRFVLSGATVGVSRQSTDGLQRELRVALKRAATRAGARYLEHTGCLPSSAQRKTASSPHALRQAWDGISRGAGELRAAEGPFNVALVWWIGLLFVIARTRWATKRAEVRGRRFFPGVEGLVDGVLWTILVAVVPARLIAFGLHELFGEVHIPALATTASVDVAAVQLALLIATVEVLATFGASEGVVSAGGYPIGLPLLYYVNLGVGWLLGWARIAFLEGESSSFVASLELFRPPGLWNNWIQDAATFALALASAIPICASLAEWRRARLRSRTRSSPAPPRR